jgi:predicted nucleotide-binding protein
MAKTPHNPSMPPKYSIEQAIPLLQRQLDRLEKEIINLAYNDPEVDAWEQRMKTLLNDIFGQPNGNLHDNTNEFVYASTGQPIRMIPYGGRGPSPQYRQQGHVTQQKKRIALLKQYIEQLEEEQELSKPPIAASQAITHRIDLSLSHSERDRADKSTNHTVFIGHGHSLLWRELKDFLQDTLKLKYQEFNSESTAGISTTERLEAMLNSSGFAFLVMTAEDERADGTLHPRENVIHEAGLFQGRLGFRRAIILREEGCQEFSNIHGLTQILFPKGRISAIFEEIRKVLEREGTNATQ